MNNFKTKVTKGALLRVTTTKGKAIKLSVGKFVPTVSPELVAAKIISKDTKNNLTVGSDGKLIALQKTILDQCDW